MSILNSQNISESFAAAAAAAAEDDDDDDDDDDAHPAVNL